eukprot:3804802-Rhodomonas_salina.1
MGCVQVRFRNERSNLGTPACRRCWDPRSTYLRRSAVRSLNTRSGRCQARRHDHGAGRDGCGDGTNGRIGREVGREREINREK